MVGSSCGEIESDGAVKADGVSSTRLRRASYALQLLGE